MESRCESSLRRRILELERRSNEVDNLLALTDNEKFAWQNLCDIRKRVDQCMKQYNVSVKLISKFLYWYKVPYSAINLKIANKGTLCTYCGSKFLNK